MPQRARTRAWAAALLAAMLPAAAAADPPAGKDNDTCLLFYGKGQGHRRAHLIHCISKRRVRIARGDVLEYEIFVPSKSLVNNGGVDVLFTDQRMRRFRDVQVDGKSVTDQNGIPSHPAARLDRAVGKWYARKIPLDAAAGRTTERLVLIHHGSRAGDYVILLDNIRIRRADGPAVTYYENGAAPLGETVRAEGYSKHPGLISVPRAAASPARDLAHFARLGARQAARQRACEAIIEEWKAIRSWLDQAKYPRVAEPLSAAGEQMDRLLNDTTLTPDAFDESLKKARNALAGLALSAGSAARPRLARLQKHPGHIVVDFGKQLGPATWRASGFLHGMSKDRPTDPLIAPLRPQMFRDRLTWMGGAAGVLGNHHRVKKLGATHVLVLSDSHGYGRGPHKWWPGDNGDWSKWEALVEGVVKRIQQAGCSVQYDIWNEPDIEMFWKFGVKTKQTWGRWLKTWEVAHKKIRSLDPKAVIVGPSLAGYREELFKSYLQYAKERGVLPDVFSWHQMGLDLGFVRKAETVRAMMKQQLGVKELPISINEFAGPTYQFSPGALVQFFAVFEQAKILSASKSCWDDEGCSNCNNVSLNGLLTHPEQRPRSAWWAYKGYADVTGTLVHVSRKGAIHAVAGHDPASKQARVVLGLFHGGGAGPHAVRFNNLDKARHLIRDGKVHVTAAWIPNTRRKELARPIAALEGEYEVRDNTLVVALPHVGPTDAYTLRLVAAR